MILAVTVRCRTHPRGRFVFYAAAPEPRTQRRADWGLCARLWGLRAYAHPARIREFFEAVLRAPRSLLPSLVNCVQQPTSGSAKQFPGLSFVRVSLHAQQHGARNVEPAGTSVGEIRNV